MESDSKDTIIKSFIEECNASEKYEPSLSNVTYGKENFVQYKMEDVAKDYEIIEQLGQGSFGVVLKGIHKQTQQERALKVIPRSKITRKIERFINEVNALKKLDHPNVIRLYEVYESDMDVILVQEFWKGGELMKRFESYDTINEHKVANIFKQILLSIEYWHQNEIAHRDLKPENFMFASEKEDSKLKLIDFGLATRLSDEKLPETILKNFKSRVGTIIFMAPEVIKQSYTWKCDLWSAGVILYILIWGYPPFYGESEYDTISKILDYDLNFDHDIWNVVTPELKDMINHLIVPEDERFNAQEALEHEWIKKHELDDKVLSQDLPNYFQRIKKFQTYNHIKRIILTYFCTRLQDSKVINEVQMFEFLDKNNDGVLDLNELKSNVNLTSKDFTKIYESIDTDKNGVIDYTEWLAAAKDWSGWITVGMIKDAFNMFDQDSDGEIVWQDFKEVLDNEQEQTQQVSKMWKHMVAEVDSDQDGKIKLDDFMKLFESKLSLDK